MAAPKFELITELQTLTRRDFPVKDPDILKPISTNPLVEGEWLDLDLDQKLIRGASQTMSVYPVHTERGRYDTQAIGKANVLFLGQFEAKTAVYETNGAPTYTTGAPLKVATMVRADLANKRGLAPSALSSGDVVVGYISKPPANGMLRFVRVSPFKVP
jgi:hypothetical protein